MIFSLVQDFSDVLTAMPREHPRYRILKLLDEAIRRDVHFIDRHPTTFFQCMWNTCWWYDCPEGSDYFEYSEDGSLDVNAVQSFLRWDDLEPELSQLMERLLGVKQAAAPDFYWLRSVRPPGIPLGGMPHMTLVADGSIVFGVAASADGATFAASTLEQHTIVWNSSGKRMHCLASTGVGSVEFSPDGRFLACAGLVRVWDVNSGLLVHEFTGARERGIAFSTGAEAALATLSFDAHLTLWDLCTGKPMRSAELPQDATCIQFTPDGHSFVIGHRDGTLRVWQTETLCPLRVIKSPDRVTSISISASGHQILAVGNGERLIRVWDLGTGSETGAFDFPMPICGVLSPNQEECAIGDQFGSIHLLDFQSGKSHLLRAHGAGVNSLAYTADGRRLISGSTDGTVRVWSIGVGDRADSRPQAHAHTQGISDLQFSPRGDLLATASQDSSVGFWDGSTGVKKHRLKNLLAPRHMAFTSDGDRLAVATAMGIWVSGNERWAQVAVNSSASRIAWSGDGLLLAAAMGHRALVFETTSWIELLELRGHTDQVNCLAFLSGRQTLVTASQDRTARAWELTSGNEVARIHLPRFASDLCPTETGKLVTVHFDEGLARTWDVESNMWTEVPPQPQMMTIAAPDGPETVITVGGQTVGWYSAVSNLRSNPIRAAWAGSIGKDLHIFTLEQGTGRQPLNIERRPIEGIKQKIKRLQHMLAAVKGRLEAEGDSDAVQLSKILNEDQLPLSNAPTIDTVIADSLRQIREPGCATDGTETAQFPGIHPAVENVSACLESIREYLEYGRASEAIRLLSGRETDPLIANAHAVCLLRLGDAERAIEVLRPLVLPPVGSILRRDVPTVFKTNYATALLMSNRLPECRAALRQIEDKHHPAVERLRLSITRWRDSLTLWQRLGTLIGLEPNKPVRVEPPVGELQYVLR